MNRHCSPPCVSAGTIPSNTSCGSCLGLAHIPICSVHAGSFGRAPQLSLGSPLLCAVSVVLYTCTHWASSSICSARPLGSTWAAPSCTSPENSLKAASPGNHGFTTFVSPSRGSLVSTAWCPASIPPLARCSAVAGQRVNPVSVSLSQRKAEICPDVSDVALLLLLGQEWRQTLLSGQAGKANKHTLAPQHWPAASITRIWARLTPRSSLPFCVLSANPARQTFLSPHAEVKAISGLSNILPQNSKCQENRDGEACPLNRLIFGDCIEYFYCKSRPMPTASSPGRGSRQEANELGKQTRGVWNHSLTMPQGLMELTTENIPGS